MEHQVQQDSHRACKLCANTLHANTDTDKHLQGFYDPLNDEFIEPERTGISYSFTEDGHYESAYYRAIANPQNPACPSGIMQWQHGSWVKNPDGGLTLTPIKDDGRQLLSEPCEGEHSIYTRYNQTEEFEVSIFPRAIAVTRQAKYCAC